MSHSTPRGGLWHHRDFLRLWGGQTISVFGSMIGSTAMTFTAVLVLHASPLELGVLAAAGMAPGLFAGPFAGAWVDRLARRPILIAADLGRAAALATVPLAALLHLLRIEQLYVVAALVSVLSIAFDVAYQSYLPVLLPRQHLLEGNGKLSASAAIAEVGGFGVAGWLVQVFTAPIAVLIDALSFVASAASIGIISTAEPAPPLEAERTTVPREIAAGLREVLRSPLLRPAACCTLTLELSGGVYGALVVLYMSRDLGFEPGILSMIWAVGGISALLGSLAAGRASRRLGVGGTMILGLALSGASMLLVPLAEGATAIAALLLIGQQLAGDGAATVYRINRVSLSQAVASPRFQGRVSASLHFLGLGAALVGSVAGGFLGLEIGVRATLVVGACGTLLSSLWLVLSPVRRLKVVPEPVLDPLAAR